LQEPCKKNKKEESAQIHVYGKKTPSRDHDEILRMYRYPQHNHVCEIWRRLVKGFGRSYGSNFRLPGFDLHSRSIQHSCITMRVCDLGAWTELLACQPSERSFFHDRDT